MKILLVCKSLPPDVIGGIQTHTWKLADWLVRMGHEVSILIAGNWRHGIRQSRRDGRNIIALPYFPGRRLPFFSVLAEEWAFNQAATQWLRRHSQEFDLVHLQGRSGFCFPGKQLHTPVVVTYHGLVAMENEHSGRHENPSLATWLHERWASLFEKNTLLRADACIAVSQGMLRQMEEVQPGVTARTTVLTNAVDVPDDYSVPDDHTAAAKNLLFVGRFDRIKGIFPLIEALKNTHPDVHLTMVGDGPERAELERCIDRAGLRSRITFTGALSQEQVFEKIRASFALVLPSFHETQAIVLLEASACGKPVIASDLPGLRGVVRQGETGWLTPAGDTVQLATYINRLFENPAEAERLGKAGRQYVRENFAWENVALETERLYGRVLAQKSHEQLTYRTKMPQKNHLPALILTFLHLAWTAFSW